MAAAWELTRPEREDRYKVDVYTLGWRLGGKGASGRNAAACDRIEEHGLHVWFGFYRHAFAMMCDVYNALGAHAPLGGINQAFKPCPEIVLSDKSSGSWEQRAYRPPVHRGSICDPVNVTFWEGLKQGTGLVLGMTNRGIEEEPEFFKISGLGDDHELYRRTARAFEELGVKPRPIEPVRTLLASAHELSAVHADDPSLNVRHPTHEKLVKDLVAADRGRWLGGVNALGVFGDIARVIREAYMALDLFASGLIGVIVSRLLGRNWSSLDRYELTEWLKMHGLDDRTAKHAPWLRGFYDLAFGFKDGDPDQRRHRRRRRPAGVRADGVQVQRSDALQDAGGHGGHRVHTAV